MEFITPGCQKKLSTFFFYNLVCKKCLCFYKFGKGINLAYYIIWNLGIKKDKFENDKN